jgi:hypothetical protein
VEASLLPSKVIASLAKKLTLVVVRRDDPGCAELRKEFSVPFLNSWVVVLDAKGETRASWIGDAAGAGCRNSETATFPSKMAALIRRSLRISESLEELERRWQKDPCNMAAFDAYEGRLNQMYAFVRRQQICAAQAQNPQLNEVLRNEFRIREFLARAYGNGPKLQSGKGRIRFALEGEKLLVELADHPKSADLPGALFAVVYAHGFDVPARTDEAINRLKNAIMQRPSASSLHERIQDLKRICGDWIGQMEGFLQEAKDPSQKQFIAASLGDAHAAIEFFSQPSYKDVPEYRERLRDAKRKLRQKGAVAARE